MMFCWQFGVWQYVYSIQLYVYSNCDWSLEPLLVCLHVWQLQCVDPGSVQKLILLGDQHLQSISYEFFGQDTVGNCTREESKRLIFYTITETCCLKHCCQIPSVISHLQGFCCCTGGCRPPLLLRSCCHPSESPRRPQSSPAADSPLVPLAVKI